MEQEYKKLSLACDNSEQWIQVFIVTVYLSAQDDKINQFISQRQIFSMLSPSLFNGGKSFYLKFPKYI
jgi:hypothetical protein